jgi:hypothetical protein
MPLTDYDEYVAKLKENRAADFQMSSGFGTIARLCFASRSFLPAPATPTTSIALDKTSDHSIGPIPAVGSGRLTIMGARLNPSSIGGQAVILVDMLNVSGGLSGIVTTAQTTNLPTAALTRFTSGEGVMAGLCIWSSVGGTATTVTVSYTNQAGTPGQISTATQIGGSNVANTVGRILPIPLAAGDTGVQSVESVTLAGTTGTGGNFGVCLFKPLAMLAMNDFQGAQVFDAISTGGFTGALAEVHPDACLSVFGIGNVSQAVVGSIILAEV